MSYDVNKAWLRATIYFLGCWLIGWATNTVFALFSLPRPLVNNGQMTDRGWWVWTIICFAVILVGYGGVWPKGTLTHGRVLHIPFVLLFGALWGVSEGLLFVSVWHTVDQLIATDWLVVLITFLILSTFVGLWHALYWDIYVAPEHNIEEWNLRKVFFAHIPNLTVSLIYLTLYENMWVFITLQTVALMLSTYFMRFPPPTFGAETI